MRLMMRLMKISALAGVYVAARRLLRQDDAVVSALYAMAGLYYVYSWTEYRRMQHWRAKQNA
jgi:hypothetical protein